MERSLRETLIGAWRLVDVVKDAVDGSPAARPHGDCPVGLILYTPDGYMSAQIHGPLPPPGRLGRLVRAHAGGVRERGARLLRAYAGWSKVDEERGTVTHSVEVSLFPGWVGGAQLRVARLDGDVLELSGAAPEESGGGLGRHAADVGARRRVRVDRPAP